MLFKLLIAAKLLGSVFGQDATSAASAASSAASSAVGTGVTTGTAAQSSAAPELVGTPSAPAPNSVSGVPTGTPVPGNYTGPLRPQVHFSPPAGFMNDPNGMFVDADGVWHLYYQCKYSSGQITVTRCANIMTDNPTNIVAGNQHWGHATSRDLYRWENQPIAIFPPNNFTFVFSGSAVVDVNNTSGFFPNQTNGVVAIYTLAEYPGGQAGPQQQAIAYSFDNGYTFIPYEGNPVIPSESSQFRDPKVIWVQDQWVMVIAYAQEFAIGIFTSPDLLNWTATSNFSYHGLLGAQYECPNLQEVPVQGTDETAFVLAISLNPGAPLGGSITEYFVGDFNGTHFNERDGRVRLTDFGKDNYAGQFFYGVGGPNEDAVSIAWASNWQYTQIVPTGQEGWRSVMSLPRRQYLAEVPRTGLRLFSAPYGLDAIRGDEIASNSSLNNGTLFANYGDVESLAVLLEVNVTGINASLVTGASTVNFTFFNPSTGESLRGGYYLGGDNPFFLDRGSSGNFDNVFFTDKFSAAYPIGDRTEWSMTALIDRSIFEVFIDGGADAATITFFPSQPLTSLAVSSAVIPDGVEINVAVYAVQSAWAEYQNEQGTVLGNVTQSEGGNSAAPAKRHMIYEATF